LVDEQRQMDSCAAMLLNHNHRICVRQCIE